MERLVKKISEKIKKVPDEFEAYEDLYHICLEIKKSKKEKPLSILKWLSKKIEEAIIRSQSDNFLIKQYNLHKKVLLELAPEDFDSYLRYVEWNRDPKTKFYIPRKSVLKGIVKLLQDLSENKINLLGISLPPGTGKSTLAIFYLTWLSGKYPHKAILSASHSNSFIRGVYDECLRILSPNGEYLWSDVFPNVKVSNTNAKDCRIDLGKRKRFETLEFTSIGTGNAGLYRASKLLYCDDLVSGNEVALSKERLDKLWGIYTVDLRQRKIGDTCGELHIATRWSVHDPIGRLESTYSNKEKARFVSIPALNEKDESNFDYPYGVGFSTDFFHKQRSVLDDISWRCLYLNQPIEREGLLYHKDELRRYFELPQEPPDSVIAVCDTKDKGKDFCVMPIAYKYGDNYYIDDFICDNSNPDIVDQRLVNILLKHKVNGARFESNSAGGRTAKEVQRLLRGKGGKTNITTKYTTANKETKIILSAGFVKEHFIFKDDSVSDREYQKAMDFLCSYTQMGKNAHDDVPDAMAMLVDYIDSLVGSKVEIFQRPW